MLSEKIGEFTGKVTTQRVLPADASGPKMETSFQSTGKILGVEVNELGTYSSVMRAGGVVYGEGQGVYLTKDGESCSWVGSGVGKPSGRGMGISYRGAVYYQTTAARLARLNSMCAVFEYEVDENGNTRAIMSEWK